MNTWCSMIRFFVVGCVTVCLASCGGDLDPVNSSSDANSANTGTLKMYVQTNPVYFLPSGPGVVGFHEVNLALKQVQVYHQNSKKWIDVPLTSTFSGKFVDFKKFTVTQNQEHLLAENTVPAGHYDQVKIIFDQNQSGQVWKNYVRANNGTVNGEYFAVNYVAGVADGFIIPASIDVAAGQGAWLGLTMDLRSLFGMIDRTYTYKPVALAVDLTQAGNIEINVGVNAGDILVSAQRNGKIIRSMYAPAVTPLEVEKKFLLTQLPKTSDLADKSDTYQVVLTSNSTATKIIKNVAVKGGGQTISILTSTPISFAQYNEKTLTVTPSKVASEVMGVMAAELIQSVRFSDTETISVVAGYTLSPVGELVADQLLRNISFTYAESSPEVADFSTLPLQFQAYAKAYRAFTVRVDPDLDSSAVVNPF